VAAAVNCEARVFVLIRLVVCAFSFYIASLDFCLIHLIFFKTWSFFFYD
jgi:hypothetical protein